MKSPSTFWKPLILSLFFLATPMSAAEVWNAPAFSVDPATLRHAAEAIKPGKHDEATVLLDDLHFSFDGTGKLLENRHLIYRIENQQGVEDWAETSGQWESWHQAKPEIKARVITTDGAEHWLDPKTLSDVPVHENAPDTYSDERKYGGPLPALAPGAIVEEQVITRDTAPLFAAGTVERWRLGWNVPVNKIHIVFDHPESVPLHYQLHLLSDAIVTKSHQNAEETITIEQGPLPAYTEQTENVPADVVLEPEMEFSTATSWQQVASEYARLSDDKLRPSDVQALLKKINLKDGSRNDVIRRIVAALHKNVRYTGVEFGESSLIPQYPSETLKRKYGDCKDKATLLVAMLRGAGIPASLVLLDSGPGRDINTNLPGMGLFDHAIVYVPASGSDSELWVDATAQYSQVGTLPWMDYGRWALVIGAKADPLKKIPDLTSSQNVYRELREFTLVEHGKATIAETDDEIGPAEADFRDTYDSNSKEVRKKGESYVKDMYLADSLTALEHGDLSDLEKPGSVKFVATGRRGSTDLTRALMAIRVEALFDHLPKYFRTKEDEPAVGEDAAEKQPPRTADWWIWPYTAEWHYKVTAPLGFKLRALPSDKNEKIGTLSFTQKYSTNPEGTIVEAVLRVENPNTRLTVQQAKDLRDAVLKVQDSDPIFITFDNVGYALISAGKIKDGLAAYRQMEAQHPKEALHKVQLAQALLTAGLGEQARSVAREATNLEPNSALAFSTLGMVLKHDLIGRLEKKGMDLDGAIAAYRKAIALDPKDKEMRANLALLLEFDADGTRYGERAGLKDAVEVLRGLKKLDDEYSHAYDDNVLYDLWYAHDYQGVIDYAATLPTSDVRKGLTLAAIALQQGTESALKKSLEITTDNQGRGQALVNAGAVLVRVRKYPEGAAMLAEGAHGQSNESQLMRSAALFNKTKPYEDLIVDRTSPRGVAQQLMGDMLSGKLTLEELKALTYDDPKIPNESMDQKQFQQMMSTLKLQVSGAGLPLITLADLATANMHYTIDGDDSVGYKIIIESPGAPAQNLYVVKNGDRYQLAAYSVSGPADLEDLGPLVLRAIDQNNLAAARKWLDRAREKISINGGDDPLGGNPFPYFWTKGQESDVATIRTAALVLLRSKGVKGSYLEALTKARQSAKTDMDHNRLTMVLAYAYSAQERWAEMLPVAQELMKALPTSLRAFQLAATAYTGLKQYDDWDKLVQARMHQYPDELAYVRSSANLAAYRGDFAKSREILKGIIDKGQSQESDLNSYAWNALYLPGPIDQDSLDVAERANELTKNANFAILHTLACLEAQAGKPNQARELLLKAMTAQNLEEPNEAVWFGFGLIAEQYGVNDAAEKMFKLVEKPKIDQPTSTYALAQQHLAALHKVATEPAKTAAR